MYIEEEQKSSIEEEQKLPCEEYFASLVKPNAAMEKHKSIVEEQKSTFNPRWILVSA